MPLTLLAVGQRDDAAECYLATLAPSSARVARSQLEQVARWLLYMPDASRARLVWVPGATRAFGARRLHLDLGRVPWSSVTAADAQRVRHVALGGPRSRRTVASMLGALRGVLRAASVLTVAHLDALRVDGQADGAGRSVAGVMADWRADEGAEQQAHQAAT